ncbi:hypothetical protein C5C49_11795 [Rathayibacter sp. AY1E2]|nr:hypothetical protein C5C49_11795 [Rathayibacter sp. AY1E2]
MRLGGRRLVARLRAAQRRGTRSHLVLGRRVPLHGQRGLDRRSRRRPPHRPDHGLSGWTSRRGHRARLTPQRPRRWSRVPPRVSGGSIGAGDRPDETTERLRLFRPAESDLDELWRLYSDERIAAGDPLLRHGSVEQTRAVLARRTAQWARDDLSSWVVRLRSPEGGGDGAIGIGGCTLLADTAWNVAFTVHPDHWGRGYAQEVASAGIARARRLRPELPVTAVVAERNERSHRTVARLGLERRWEGPDAHSPDPAARIVLYSDRLLSEDEIGRLTS